MKNTSLKTKIIFLSIFMTVVAVIIGSVSQIYSTKTIAKFEKVVHSDVRAMRAMNRMLLSYRMARIELLQLTSNSTTEQADVESLKAIEAQWLAYDADEKIFEDSLDSNDEKELFSTFKKANLIVRDDFKKAIELYNKNKVENSDERKAMAKIVLLELPSHGNILREATKALIDYESKVIEYDTLQASSAAQTGSFIGILVTIIGSIAGIFFAFVFSTRLSKQLSATIRIISESSDHVASASGQIASSSEQLSQATTEQAASLEETAASLEEIGAMIAKATSNSKSAESCSVESFEKAQEGQKAVGQMLVQMEQISESNNSILNQVNDSNNQMTEIVRVIQEIEVKTKVINEIVFQTKLLSFNASVEAARAGEQGKGFAVVAEEVGNLAVMSGNAAKEISEMLSSSMTKVEQIVSESKSKIEPLIESGKEKVNAGTEVAKQCSTILSEIVDNVSKVTNLAQEISQASQEQSLGVAEINKAMGQLDTVTQQNSATSAESAHAAEALSIQAKSLKVAVDELVVTVQGSSDEAKSNFTAQINKKNRQAKPVVVAQPKANVIAMKNIKNKNNEKAVLSNLKMAAGANDIPDSNHKGFRDI